MITLPDMLASRRMDRETERLRVLDDLRTALVKLLPPGSLVWIYGSAVRPGKFHEESDIDLAIEDPSMLFDPWQLMGVLCLATGRRIDICRLEESRLAEIIRREGQLWTL